MRCSRDANAKGFCKKSQGSPAKKVQPGSSFAETQHDVKVQHLPIKYKQTCIPVRLFCNVDPVFLLFTLQSLQRNLKNLDAVSPSNAAPWQNLQRSG